MNRLIAPVVACALLASCSVSVDGPCTSDAQCTAPATCDLKRSACVLPCEPKCGVGQLCIDRACVQQGPVVKSLVAPTNWTTRAGTLAVTALVDDGQGPGTASAALHIAGQQDIAGTSTDGLTWTFQVPASTAQQPGHETPVAFTIDAIDKAGHATLPDAVGTGQLLIDDVGATLPSGVLANGGVVAAGGLSWFPAGSGNIDVQAVIADAGSGVKQDTLTLMDGATRLDVGTPTCTGAASSLTCHFTVPKSVVPAGSQRVVRFAVAGTDVAGNPLAANAAALGIDGKPPVVTLTVGDSGTTTLYPPKNADCGAPLDSTLYCGHDGAHFWRAGDGKFKITFTVNDTFTAPDDVGSGPGAAGATCAVTGSATTCTATFDPASGSFSFPADFATAAFASAPDGTGTVTVTVNAKDAVGNGPASPVTAAIGVTRVKWMRQVPGVVSLVGAPLLDAGHQQVIVGGVSSAGDPIASVKTDGSVGTFKFGAGKFTTVTANMALDTTPSTDPAHPTPVLYVNNGPGLYAVLVADASQYCTAKLSTTNSMIGAPVLVGGAVDGQAVVVAGNAVGAFLPSFDASHACVGNGSFPFTNPPLPPPATVTPQPKLGPPSANGSTIFFAYDNSLYSTAVGAAANDLGVKSIHFAAGVFDTPAGSNLGKEPTTNTNPAAISPASDLFFGVNREGLFYRYGPDFALHWGSTPALTGNIFTQPLVRGTSVLGSSDSLVSYGLVDGKKLWQVSRGGSQVSPPTTANGSIFVSDDVAPGEMIALDPSSQAVQWTYTGGATVPVTTLQSVATEAALDADGTLYFGDSAGHVYALITEAKPIATAPGDWPRTGYDNCNSNHANNPGFSCQ